MQSLDTRPLLVDISHITLRLTHAEFVQLCQDNPEMPFELTATGELVIAAPAGWESSEKIVIWRLKLLSGIGKLNWAKFLILRVASHSLLAQFDRLM
jgi:hypothetical protein